MEIGDLPAELQELVLGEVRKDEKVIWIEQPDPHRFMLSGLPVTLVGILFTGFGSYMLHGSALLSKSAFGDVKDNSGLAFFLGIGLLGMLLGIGVLLLGLYLFAFPYLKKLSAFKTGYVLTDKRAICFNKIGLLQLNQPSKGYEILRYPPDKLINRKKVVRGNGAGDLVFVEIPIRSPGPDPYLHRRKAGFIAIKDVDGVEELLRKTFPENR